MKNNFKIMSRHDKRMKKRCPQFLLGKIEKVRGRVKIGYLEGKSLIVISKTILKITVKRGFGERAEVC